MVSDSEVMPWNGSGIILQTVNNLFVLMTINPPFVEFRKGPSYSES